MIFLYYYFTFINNLVTEIKYNVCFILLYYINYFTLKSSIHKCNSCLCCMCNRSCKPSANATIRVLITWNSALRDALLTAADLGRIFLMLRRTYVRSAVVSLTHILAARDAFCMCVIANLPACTQPPLTPWCRVQCNVLQQQD